MTDKLLSDKAVQIWDLLMPYIGSEDPPDLGVDVEAELLTADCLPKVWQLILEMEDDYRQRKGSSRLVAMNVIQASVLMDVVEERSEQDEKWGGEAHDDKHSVRDWVTYIMAYLGRIVYRENKWGAESTLARKLFIQVAALAVAAVEAMDRRHDGWFAEDDDG